MPEMLATDGFLTLDRPAAMLALLAACVPLLLALRARRLGRRTPRLSVAFQICALAALALALAQPRASLGMRTRLPYLVLMDVSGSVRGQEDKARRDLAGALPPDRPIEWLYFAAGVGRSPQAVATNATEASSALALAAARGREGLAGIVLVTDGRFTDPAWPAAARALRLTNVPLAILPLRDPPPDARIRELRAQRPPAGGVDITLTAESSAAIRGLLTIERAGAAGTVSLLRQQVSLLPDAQAVYRAADVLPTDQAGLYVARLHAGDIFPENDSAQTAVLPVARRFLAAGFDPPQRTLLRGLNQPVEFVGFERLPESSEPAAGCVTLDDYAAILVSDATGQALSARQRRVLAQHVRAGCGLVFLGCGPSQTPADLRDELNQVLPLAPNPFQRRPLALRVVLDRSGSMAQPARVRPDAPAQVKFDLAVEATLALRDHLTDRDSLAVVTFADKEEVVYDSAGGPPDFSQLRTRLEQVRAGGKTQIQPALEAALVRGAATGQTPMVLILSDLQTEDFSALKWAERFRQAKAELAVVAIGEPDTATQPEEGTTLTPPLRTLAVDLLKAPLIQREQLTGLAEVFGSLVRRGRGALIRQERTALLVTGPLFGTGITALPPLDSYVICAPAKQADVLARAVASTDGAAGTGLTATAPSGGDPVIGIQQSGLGRAVSIAISAGQNQAWQGDPVAARLTAAAAQWAMRPANRPGIDVKLSRQGGRLIVEASVQRDDQAADKLQFHAQAQPVQAAGQDGGKPTTIQLSQVGPEEFRGAADFPPEVTAAVEIRDEKGATWWQGAAAVNAPPEFLSLGVDLPRLTELAEITGGRIVAAGDLSAVLRDQYRRAQTPLWPVLVLLGLGLMLADWCRARISR